MKVDSRKVLVCALALLPALPACDAVETARSRFTRTDTLTIAARGAGVTLGLQTPGMLRAGEEGIIRLSVSNRADTTATGIRLELVVPGWAEPLPPRPGDREVTMAALPEGGTRFAYRMEEEPLEPGQTLSVEQRIRVPPGGPAEPGSVPWTRAVRARLLGPEGESLAEVEGEIPLEGAGGEAGAQASGPRDRLGPVRLGMTADELRRAAPGARDTTWSQEGMTERGVWIPVGDGGRALAVMSGDSVSRVEVRGAAPRTAEGLGVGSTMTELRAAWGEACAEAAEGRVVVWFPRAPGMSFALDMRPPENVAQLREDPRRIPDAARVTRWWLRRGVDSC